MKYDNIQTKDYHLTQEPFTLNYVEELEMYETYPKPINLEQYYQSTSYISHNDHPKNFIDTIYTYVKKYTLAKKVNLLNKYAKEKSILDIGCGTGEFLKLAQRKGWKTTGVEPNTKAQYLATQKNLTIKQSLNEVTEKHSIVTLWHVLEHLPNIENAITSILTCLQDKGTLFIAVPNYKSYDAQYYKQFWAAFDVPRHLWHFSETSIRVLFEKHNLHIVATKPMIFDACYVSLLSEKYKTGKTKFIKAIFIGLLSNLKALKTKEYSSKIYILQKKS